MVSTSWVSVFLSTLSVAVPSEAGNRDDLVVVLVVGPKKPILYLLLLLLVVVSVVEWAGEVAVVSATGGSVAVGVALVVAVVAASVGAIAAMAIAVAEEALATAVTGACEVAMAGEEISEAREVAFVVGTTLAEGAEEASGIYSWLDYRFHL